MILRNLTDIESTRKAPLVIKRYSSGLRVWHWLNLLIISGSLITVLLNSTLTSQKSTSQLIQSELSKKGTASDDQIKSIAHALSDKTWEAHIYFGYALASLLAFRLILEFFQLADQKFISRIKNTRVKLAALKENRTTVRHAFTVKIIYAIFYLLLIIMAVTGLSLAFEDSLTFLKPIKHDIKEVHGFCMYFIIAFIAIHIVGVVLAEYKNEKGIISDMVNGGKEQ